MIKGRSLKSDQLVKAYRAWDAQVKKSGSKNPYIVCVDDLSCLVRTDSFAKVQNFDFVLETFHRALQEPSDFAKKDLLKVENSLAFIAAIDLNPTRLAIENCGGIFEPTRENSIRSVTKEIKELEKNPDYQLDPIATKNCHVYAQKIISSGFEFLTSKIPGLLPLEFRFEEPLGQNLFGAQVVTDERGYLVCQIPKDQPITAFFYLTIIHEILGHVLHFTQLRSREDLRATPHLLCLSNHTHESFFIEAIAQLITTYLVKESTWLWPSKKALHLADLKYHRNQTIAHFLMTKIVEGSLQSHEAAKAHLDLCDQSGPVDALTLKYQNVVSNLFSLKVALNYAPSFNAIAPLFAKNEEDFFPVFAKIIHQYFTPDLLNIFVKEHTRGDSKCV